MIDVWYDINKYSSPLLAVAIHNGHSVRREIAEYLHINEFDRLREEDPCTGYLTRITGNRIIVNTSRFEIDVNRPRRNAIYKTPEQAWGLKVWKEQVPPKVWIDSLEEYDDFYRFFKFTVNELINTWGYVIVYDIHSYNFKRPAGENSEKLQQSPDINVGTGTLNRTLWAPAVEYFKNSLKEYNYFGRYLKVEENVVFKGGYLSEWAHRNYPDRSCVLAIEIKKIFMDELTGAVDLFQLKTLKEALFETIAGVLQRAKYIGQKASKNLKFQSPGNMNKTQWRQFKQVGNQNE